MKKQLFFFFTVIAFFCYTSVSAQDADKNDSLRAFFSTLKDSSEIYYSSANYEKSIEVNVKILNTALEINDPVLIHEGYRFLAYDYLALNDLSNVKENLKKSEYYALQSKNDNAIAVTYMDLANLFSYEDDGFDKSIKYHDKAIQQFEKIKDSISLAKANMNAAITYFYFEAYDTGYPYLEKAKQFALKHKTEDFQAGIENMYGEYYSFKKKYDVALESYLKSISIAEKFNLFGDLESSYYGYSIALQEQGNYKEALEAREKYEEYLLKNNETVQSAAAGSTSSKFQLSEYQKTAEDAKLKNELQAELMENKNRTNQFLWGLSAIGLLLTLYLWYAYRHRKRLNRELQIKNKEYLIAKEESEKLAMAKAKFFSTVSHELRTPLYGVIGLSTILLENKELKKHEKDLKSLKFSADYLLALINDVLQINKIDSQSFTDDTSTFSLRELINTIVASFEYMKLQHNNTINVVVDSKIPEHIKGSSIRLSQVLMNLIGNACKFTHDGIITIKATIVGTENHTSFIQFTVADTGKGIAKDKLESIFNEFSQLESVNQNYQGTGLGLPIVKKLLEQSNSEIAVESELGKGSTFSFKLLFETFTQTDKKNSKDDIDVQQLKGKQILIVEDNKINQTVTKKILDKEGVISSVADNGQEAIDKVQIEEFDLILMDINMPVKNGIEATQEIRNFNKTIPILALTAVEVEEIRYRIFECGMNDIIVKPYNVDTFRETVAKNLLPDSKKQTLNVL